MRWVYVQQMEELADEVKKLKYEVGLRPTDAGTHRRSQETQV